MIVKCLFNRGKDLGAPAPNSFFYTDESVFHLEVGKDYPIFGLGIWKGALLVLAVDDTGLPDWLPAGLFEFSSVDLPEGCQFSVLDGVAVSSGRAKDDWVAVWGYPELVADPSHRDGLAERDPDALTLFYSKLERRLYKADQSLNFSITFTEQPIDHMAFFDCVIDHDGLGTVVRVEIPSFRQQLRTTPSLHERNDKKWSYDDELDMFYGYLAPGPAIRHEKRKGRAGFDKNGALVRLDSLRD